MDTDASTADSRVVEPDIKHDCDVLILEYVVWDALSSVITRAQTRSTRKEQPGSVDSKDANLHEITDKLRMVDCTYLLLASSMTGANHAFQPTSAYATHPTPPSPCHRRQASSSSFSSSALFSRCDTIAVVDFVRPSVPSQLVDKRTTCGQSVGARLRGVRLGHRDYSISMARRHLGSEEN